VGVKGMEKKGPETWGRDRSWEGEAVAVRVAQKGERDGRDSNLKFTENFLPGF